MQANLIRHSIFSLLVITSVSCSSSIPDAESNKKSSNVATTEKDGVVTAEISSSSTSDQTVVASSSSEIADASITFPPGSIAVNTSMALGEATDTSSAIVTELGLATAVVKSAAPVFIGTAAIADMPTAASALALSLPLPLSDSGIKLTAETGKLVFFYAILTKEGWKSGVKPLTSADLVGTFLSTKVLGLGYFQISYVTTAVEAKEMTTAIRPSLKTRE